MHCPSDNYNKYHKGIVLLERVGQEVYRMLREGICWIAFARNCIQNESTSGADLILSRGRAYVRAECTTSTIATLRKRRATEQVALQEIIRQRVSEFRSNMITGKKAVNQRTTPQPRDASMSIVALLVARVPPSLYDR